ncbi:hypothetical protein DFH28DRAFT_889855, partial [Melampsora americana]
HEKNHHILALMGRDYLAFTGSLCIAKQIFSCTADVCPSSCGSLIPRMIENLVSTRLWMREGVGFGRGYEDLANAFNVMGIPMT